MLTIAVVIIAIVLVLANLDIVIALAVWAGILAVGLAVLAAVIAIFALWPEQVIGTICGLIVIYLIIDWDMKREEKRQAKLQSKEHQPN